MKHYGDICEIRGDKVPLVDIVCGGSPCQDLSVAGRREGLQGQRSGLFMEQIRVIKEMRDECIRQLQMRGADIDLRCVQPRYMVWENVYGAFSSPGIRNGIDMRGEDFRIVLEETAKVAKGDACIPKFKGGKWPTAGCIMGDGFSLAWRGTDNQFWGTPQRRKRISLIADFGGETAPDILFELRREAESGNSEQIITDIGKMSRSEISAVTESLSGNNTESREEGQTASRNVGTGIEETSRAVSFQERAGKPGGGKGILIQNERTGALSTLNNQSVCCLNDQSCSQKNPIAFQGQAGSAASLQIGEDVSCTIDSHKNAMVCFEGNAMSGTTQDRLNVVTYPKTTGPLCASGYDKLGTQEASNGMYVVEASSWDGSQISPTLTANNANGAQRMPDKDNFNAVVQSMEVFHCTTDNDKVQTLKARDYKDPQVVAYGLDRASSYQDITGTVDACISKGTSNQLANNDMFVANTSVVRRLTPLECERLQGFPDFWTSIGDWTDSKGKKHKDADSPRYKALGNSIALPYWTWMAERMVKKLRADGVEKPTMASLFDGIGGFPLVYSRCGCKPVWASEIEEFPIAVTKKRFGEDLQEGE